MTEPDDADERLAHLRGALRLLGASVEAGADIVEDMHAAISAAPVRALAAVPEARVLARAHEGVRRSVYASIRGISRLLFRGLDAGLALAGPAVAPRRRIPGPLVGVLHGIVGDGLDRDANPMRITMHLRHAERPVDLDHLAGPLTHHDGRLVVFVHGLACDESSWQHASMRAWGRPGVSYASLLRERGTDTLHVRYNSGLKIAANGRLLAALLEQLLRAYPGELRELTLVGHSMGGLVVRSACHHGQVDGLAWTARVRDVICLGSPHGGAPLEKFGALAVAVLERIAVTAALGRAIDRRSAGIKDLRVGAVVDNDADDVPLPHARYHFLAGSYGRAHPVARVLGHVVGDGLVRVASARHERGRDHGAGDRERVRRVHLGGLHHMHLLNHPEVFAYLEAALGRAG